MIRRFIIMIALVVLLAACGPEEVQVTVVPTLEPPALSMVVLPMQTVDEAAVTAFENALFEATDLRIDVITVDNSAAALDALCTEDDMPTVAWLDGIAAAAADAQHCGIPDLLVARSAQTLNTNPAEEESVEADATSEAASEADATAEATPDAGETPEAEDAESEATPEPDATPEVDLSDLATGLGGQIVVTADLGVSDLTAITDRAFCRLNVTDVYSWLLPVLAFDAAGIDLSAAASEIIDHTTLETLLEDVSSGVCAYGGVPLGTPLPENVSVVQATPSIPFRVLVSGADVQLGVRLSVNATLVEMAQDAESAAIMRPFLRQDALIPAGDDPFVELYALLTAAGVDLSQLGQ